MMEKKKKSGKLREWLISLAVTLVLLGCVVGFQFWLTDAVQKSLDPAAFWRGNIIGDAVGGFILLLIVHHFVKRPADDKDPYKYK